MIPFLTFAVPLAGWCLFAWILLKLPGSSLFLIPGFMGGVAATAFGFYMACLWGSSYWLHDMKSGDTIAFPGVSQSRYEYLSQGSRVPAVTGTASLVVVDWQGECPEPLFAGKITAKEFDVRSKLRLTVLGRAVKPDYRYLVGISEPGCDVHYLVDPLTLASIKAMAKAAVLSAAIGSKDALDARDARLKAEASSVEPLPQH